MGNENGEKKMLWRTIGILMSIVTILVGIVWGITWVSTITRVLKIEETQTTIITDQTVLKANYENIIKQLDKIDKKLDGMK